MINGKLMRIAAAYEISAAIPETGDVDLALVGAAQRVEHYEIAAYTTARNLALQLRQTAVVHLLTLSLGEEQNAGQLLDQIALLNASTASREQELLDQIALLKESLNKSVHGTYETRLLVRQSSLSFF